MFDHKGVHTTNHTKRYIVVLAFGVIVYTCICLFPIFCLSVEEWWSALKPVDRVVV